MADKAHAETDAILADMEKHLSAIYTRAGKENQKKARDFFKQFNRLDKQHKADVQSGKWTEEQYQEWKKNKMLYSQRFNHLKEQISADLVNTNKTALDYINNQLPEVYAINYNALDGEIAGYSFELTDAETVKNLATTDKSLLPYKELDETKDIRWNTKHINAEVLQGILQGDSMDEIAKRFQKVTNMDEVAAIRNARTTVTGAENIGRLNSYKQAQKDGIRLQKEWLATNDGRTRHAHALLNGQVQNIDKPFKSEFGDIMFPADPEAHPANVYNCRCTLISKFLGFGKETESYSDFDNIIDISGSPVEFWMNMDESQQKKFKESGMKLDELYNRVKSSHKSVKKEDPRMIWKPAAKGSTEDFKIKADFTKGNIEIKKIKARTDGWMADADRTGIIEIRDDGLGENWDFVICHEAGHQLSNMSNELSRKIMLNPDDIFGRYNMKAQAFDGVFGEYSPEEAFATSVSCYYRKPDVLKEKYPKTFEAIDNLFKSSDGAKEYVDKAVNAYKEAFNV